MEASESECKVSESERKLAEVSWNTAHHPNAYENAFCIGNQLESTTYRSDFMRTLSLSKSRDAITRNLCTHVWHDLRWAGADLMSLCPSASSLVSVMPALPYPCSSHRSCQTRSIVSSVYRRHSHVRCRHHFAILDPSPKTTDPVRHASTMRSVCAISGCAVDRHGITRSGIRGLHSAADDNGRGVRVGHSKRGAPEVGGLDVGVVDGEDLVTSGERQLASREDERSQSENVGK